MRSEDKQEFFKTWAAAWELCGKTVSPTMLLFAYQSLLSFDLRDIQRAVMEHSVNPDVGQFPPKPADIVRIIEGSGDDNAMLAWGKVETAVTKIGSWHPLVFDDPKIHAVVEQLGGYLAICSSDIEKFGIMRSWFLKAYKALGDQPFPYLPVVWGSGGSMEQLRLIGDPEAARKVLAGGSSAPVMITDARNASEVMARLEFVRTGAETDEQPE